MLTDRGLWSLISSYISLVLAATLFIYPPLLIANFTIAVFLTSYMLLAHRRLRMIRESWTPAERDVHPAVAAVGQPVDVRLQVKNETGDSLLISVSDSYNGLELIDGMTSAEAVLASGETITISYRLRSGRRGEYEIGPAVVRILDTHRLWVRRYHVGPSSRILISLPAESWVRVGDTSLRSYGGVGGSGVNPLIGADEIFREVRKYEEGDPVRRIAWKRTARDADNEIYLKQYDHYSSINIALLIDCSYSMAFGSPLLLDKCLTAIQSLTWTFLAKGDRVTVTTFGAERNVTVRSSSYAADYPLIIRLLSQVKLGGPYTLSQLAENVGPAHLVFILSRFAYSTSGDLAAFNEDLRRKGITAFLICPILDPRDDEPYIFKILRRLEEARIEEMRSRVPSLKVFSTDSLIPNMLNLYRTYGWRLRAIERR